MTRANLYAVVLRGALALLIVAWPRFSFAHPSPSSQVLLDLGVSEGVLVAEVPREELAQARPGAQMGRDELSTYFQEHTRLVSAQGHPWTVGPFQVHEEARETGPLVIAEARLVPPRGEEGAPFVLHYDAVAHQVRSHYIQIGLRGDWYAGLLGSEITPVATLHFSKMDAPVSRGTATFAGGLKRAIALGASHIASGTDHLLYLLVLLLACSREPRTAPKRLVTLLSAFTVGHAITLIFAAKSWISVPARPVEVAVALSILGTALAVLRATFRPLGDGDGDHDGGSSRSPLPVVTAAFGLVHGLAFAELFAGNAPATMRSLWTLAAFNIGVELQQILIVAAVAPWLFLLARSNGYVPFQRLAAVVAAGIALVWTVARAFGLPSAAIDAPLEALRSHPLVLLGLFVAFVAVARRVAPRADTPDSGATCLSRPGETPDPSPEAPDPRTTCSPRPGATPDSRTTSSSRASSAPLLSP